MFFSTYLGLRLCLEIWAKFTGVDPQFVCRKAIREKWQVFLPYLSFRPTVLPSSHLENVDLREIVGGGVARFRIKYVNQVTVIRIGQN